MQYPPNNQPPFQQQPNTYYPSMIPPPPPPRPPKKQNPWLVIAIVCGAIILLAVAGQTAYKHSIEPSSTLQTLHTWHGSGDSTTNAFSIDGIWHIRWHSLSERSDLTMSITLKDFDSGSTLQFWQSSCDTQEHDQVIHMT